MRWLTSRGAAWPPGHILDAPINDQLTASIFPFGYSLTGDPLSYLYRVQDPVGVESP